MRVLIACEFSGVVRDAFLDQGHDAYSCDLLPCTSNRAYNRHYQGDVLQYLGEGWDLMIAHPPCTYLSSSGLHWNCRTPGRYLKTRQAIEFAEALWHAPIPTIALENPIGCLPTHSALMKATQTIQPYEFGHDASKATCLWLKGLMRLLGTQYIEPRYIDDKPRWANQTDSGQNNLGPSETRAADRAVTYTGIAVAMAEQWGKALSGKTDKGE